MDRHDRGTVRGLYHSEEPGVSQLDSVGTFQRGSGRITRVNLDHSIRMNLLELDDAFGLNSESCEEKTLSGRDFTQVLSIFH